jgi:hypothetical protein
VKTASRIFSAPTLTYTFLALTLFGCNTAASALVAAPLRLHTRGFLAPGSFEVRADWNGQAGIILESSADLKNWAFATLLPAVKESRLSRTQARSVRRPSIARGNMCSASGTIRDIESQAPVTGATLRLSFTPESEPDMIASSDSDGAIQFTVAPVTIGSFQMLIEKSDYQPLTIYGYYDTETKPFMMRLPLAPLGYRPPNDDFKDRASLQGTNITIEANTVGATSEPGHSLGIMYDDVFQTFRRTRWWTWTAPADGAVAIDLDQTLVWAGLIVYTGESLDELAEIWNSSQEDDGFFVSKGVTYQIAFGTAAQGPAAFTLRMIAPIAPTIRVQPYPGSPMRGPLSEIYAVGEAFGLTVEAQGTEFLHYQWRKDGVDLPNATGPFLGVGPLELKDGGAYSVLVSNKVGAVLSDEVQITVLQERPHLPEIMRGTWAQRPWSQQDPGDHVIVNFSDTEFSVTANGAAAGRGTYRLTETPFLNHYRLVMTYTESAPGDIENYVITLRHPATQVPYAGTMTPSGSPPNFGISGTFTRIP